MLYDLLSFDYTKLCCIILLSFSPMQSKASVLEIGDQNDEDKYNNIDILHTMYVSHMYFLYSVYFCTFLTGSMYSKVVMNNMHAKEV